MRIAEKELDIPLTIKSAMHGSFDDQNFLDEVDNMAVQAFDDQCTGANPLYPLIADLKEIYLKAYFGSHRKHHVHKAVVKHGESIVGMV